MSVITRVWYFRILKAVKKIFGDVEYEPTYVLYQSGDAKMLIYEPSENVYYMYGGFGGGSNKFTHHAITKVEDDGTETEALNSKRI